MQRARDIINSWRVATLWLLVVCVFFGPIGLSSTAAAAAASKNCGVSCPCDKGEHDNDSIEHNDHTETDPCDDDSKADCEHDDGEPCQDECPDDCPNCGCCLGTAMAVLLIPVTSTVGSDTSALVLLLMDAPPSGVRDGIFRPPRSLN